MHKTLFEKSPILKTRKQITRDICVDTDLCHPPLLSRKWGAMHVCLHFAVLPTLRYTLSSGDHSLVLYGFFSSFLKKTPSSNSTGFTCLTLSLLVRTEFSYFFITDIATTYRLVCTRIFIVLSEYKRDRFRDVGRLCQRGKTDLSRPFQMPLPTVLPLFSPTSTV